MSRRNTELLLLIASAFPVILLYAMYVLTAGAAISFETLAVPIGLFAAFAAAHIAVRILAPGADPAILPIVFVLSGIGITFVTRLAPAQAADGYEMDAIASVVIGGASLSGGKGKVSGTFIGAILLAVIRNGLNILNVSSFWQKVVIGLVIAFAVSFDTLRRKVDAH